jgi:subtilisin family serine protease
VGSSKEHDSLIRIPPTYAVPPPGLERTRFCTAVVRRAFFVQRTEDRLLRAAVRRFELCTPVPQFGIPTAPVASKRPEAGPKGVVIGVIDDGIAFANERFRTSEITTRIEHFWSQDGRPEVPPAGYFTGWELDQAAINIHLAAAAGGGFVDEDHVYRATHHVDFARGGHQPVALRLAHGTHVMDLAAGRFPADAAARLPIIAVQLPVATTADTSGATLGSWVLEAMRYILENAGRRSVVVNLSYGLIAGPHDGSSILEQALEELVTQREANPATRNSPLRIVLPSGNSRQARCHAQFALNEGDRRALSWRILPDDRTPSFMEMWLPHVAGARVRIHVTTPSGETATIRPGEEWVWRSGIDVLAKVLYLNTIVPGRNRPMIFFAVAPTATNTTGRETAPAGTWRIRVANKGPRIDVDAWIQRDDTPYGYPRRGRQSRFEDPDYVRYDYAGRVVDDSVHPASYVKRDGTMNAIATGRQPIVVGAFRCNDGHTLEYSAGGQLVNSPNRGAPSNHGPDVMAVGDDSDAYKGVLASGTRSRTTVAMNGTSVAAPQVTRLVAQRLTAGPLLGDRADVAARAEIAPPPGMEPPPLPERGGAGRLFLPRDPRPHRRRYE